MENKRNIIKVAAAVLVLVAAGILVAQYDTLLVKDAAPDDAASALPWYCHSCQRGFELTPRQYEGKMSLGRHPLSQAPGETGDTPDRGVMLTECPFCGGGAVRARKCPIHGEFYDPLAEGTAAASCSKCGTESGRRSTRAAGP